MCSKYLLYKIFHVFYFHNRIGLRKLFINENFPIYGTTHVCMHCIYIYVCVHISDKICSSTN